MRPARDVLFTVLPREDKYQAKSFSIRLVIAARDPFGAGHTRVADSGRARRGGRMSLDIRAGSEARCRDGGARVCALGPQTRTSGERIPA